jgi:phage baseplate assembly protein W
MSSLYSDLNEISPTTQPLLYDIVSIQQALYNLFNTPQNQRLFVPAYGFNLPDELFEIIGPASTLAIKRLVIQAITNWETRVTINIPQTTITPDPNNNAYELNLVFSVNGLVGQQFTFQATFTNTL